MKRALKQFVVAVFVVFTLTALVFNEHPLVLQAFGQYAFILQGLSKFALGALCLWLLVNYEAPMSAPSDGLSNRIGVYSEVSSQSVTQEGVSHV